MNNKLTNTAHHHAERRAQEPAPVQTDEHPAQAPLAQRYPQLPLLLDYPLNDDGNADRFLALYGHVVAYCPETSMWLAWDKNRWIVDPRGFRVRKLMLLAMELYSRQARENEMDTYCDHANNSLNANHLRSALIVAESKVRSIDSDQLDRNPDLLNFANGTLNLRTGALMPPNPDDWITKVIDCEYQPEAFCPQWQSFLNRVLGGDAELIEYIQNALGYSLTGHTLLKCLFVLAGDGNNGKTTFLDVFRTLISGYATMIRTDTLLASRSDSNKDADLADLRGARFAQTSELEEKDMLSVAKLKQLTQGCGLIKTARKYENPMTFRETHKIWMDSNFPPRIRNINDLAARNRLNIIPFRCKIAPSQIDPELREKLLAEGTEILAWAVKGAVRWYENGKRLERPACVVAEAVKWQKECDWLAKFLADRCFVASSPDLASIWHVEAQVLYDAYAEWAKEGNDDCVRSIQRFGSKVKEHPMIRFQRTSAARLYYGVKLRRSGRVGCSRDEQSNEPEE